MRHKLTHLLKGFLGALALSALIAAPAAADEAPYAQADDTWISIDGRVTSVDRDSFELDYGEGSITVEMDDGDRDADAYKLIEGDEVTVNGLVDDDLFETQKIEASSVYVDKLDTYFYASSLDEEDAYITSAYIPSETVIQGTVTSIDDEEFTLDTGLQEIRVDTDQLGVDPLDESGYLEVEVGDRVSVTGEMDSDFFSGREFEADTLTELYT